MDLDILRKKWAEQDQKLDGCIRLNRQLLIAAKMNRLRRPLRRFSILVGIGVVTGLTALVILGQFIYAHWTEPRFALPAVLLHLWVIAYVATSARQIAMAHQIDYDQPIVLIQKQIESLRALRLRTIRWALLTGQLVWWIPFLVVVLKGMWDVDAYAAFGVRFLSINVAMGLALIPAAILISRHFQDRASRSTVLQRLMRDLAGYNLAAASDFLATLAAFEQEGN